MHKITYSSLVFISIVGVMLKINVYQAVIVYSDNNVTARQIAQFII